MGLLSEDLAQYSLPTLRTKGLGELPFRVASANSSKLTDSPNGKMLTECPERYLHVDFLKGTYFKRTYAFWCSVLDSIR